MYKKIGCNLNTTQCYGSAFTGIDSIIYAMTSDEEVFKLLRELNSSLLLVLNGSGSACDIERCINLDDGDKRTEARQINEADEIIKNSKLIDKKFSKLKTLRCEIHKIKRLSGKMTFQEVADIYTNQYKNELKKSKLTDFRGSDVFKVIKKDKEKDS